MRHKKVTISKVEAKVTSMTILCPTLNKEVVTTNYSFSGSESECEICGSHGSVNVCIMGCECGKTHDIQLSSW